VRDPDRGGLGSLLGLAGVSHPRHLICNNFNLNFIFGTVCLCVYACAFLLRRESPDMILGDKPLISEVVLSQSASVDDSRHDSGAKSVTMVASSPSRGATRMAAGEISELTDFFKKTTMTEDDHRAYHDRGWLTGNLVSFIPEVDVPTIEGTTIVCFESQLAAGVGLPPSKFLSSIMN
jgi:hypothetical protein